MDQIARTRPQDWAYLSEGGSTIVFSYTGPFHPDVTGKILRLRKTSRDIVSQGASIEEEDDLVIAFQNTVIAALVPSRFLPDLEIVLLDAEWLAALEALRDGDRPAERRAKDHIDKTRQKGMLATDLIGGADVLAVEIKPKWGFLPNSAHLSQETAEIKASTCRFCMHTRFEYKDGDPPTRYCPLDLYSKDEARVKKAVRDLWNGWVQSNGTLNNMRVFVSGKMIVPSEESYTSIREFLSAGTEAHEAIAIALLPLLQTPVLGTISSLQRSLDALDIEGILKLHSMTFPDAQDLGVGRNPSHEELQAFVASYHSVYCALDHSKLNPEHLDTYIIAYLLSATFKDCSLIFRIHRSGVSGNPSADSPHTVSIVDLDLKGVRRFERWVNLDRRIVEHYRNVVQRKVCFE